MSLPPRDIDFVPRGPVAKAIERLRHAVIILTLVVVIALTVPSFYGVRLFEQLRAADRQIVQLQRQVGTLQAQRAYDAQAADVRAAGIEASNRQALEAFVAQLGHLRDLSSSNLRQILGAVESSRLIAPTPPMRPQDAEPPPASPVVAPAPAPVPVCPQAVLEVAPAGLANICVSEAR